VDALFTIIDRVPEYRTLAGLPDRDGSAVEAHPR
jgi:hypothetical protein